MMKTVIAFFLFFYALLAYSYEQEFIIQKIISDGGIEIQRLDKQINLQVGDLLAIYSHESIEIIGYARVSALTENSDIFISTVETHNKSQLIRENNFLRKIDLTKVKNDIPARFDLTRKNEKHIASKYKPLVYAGAVQGMTASGLSKDEFLAGPTILAYAPQDWFQLNVNIASLVFGVTNFSVKNRLYESDDFQLSVENGFQYYKDPRKGSYQLTGYFDTNSNSNFKSYAKFKLFTQKPEDESLQNSEEYQKDLNLELSISYGYMFSNWNQLIFGPKIDVNKKKVGGNLAYCMVDKSFHAIFGISAIDFSELHLGRQGYLINLDFWWRF